MNKTQPTPEEITAVVSEQPDLYQPTVQPLDAVQDNGYFPIEVDAEDKELAAPSLAKLATPSSDRNWVQRFKVAAKTAVSNILNGQMTHNVALGNKRITFGKNKEEIEFGRRMASEAKRQIEEVMDGTEELTAEEAETWAAALGGGSVSMVDFAANLALLRGLGAGSVGAQLGAGWLAGRAGYEEGTMSDIDKYIAETGDKELKNYKGDKKAFAVNVVSGAIQGGVEAATSGLGRYLINNPLAKKVLGRTGRDAIRKLAATAVGRALGAGANEAVNNAWEEGIQALTGNVAEIVKGNEEFSMDNILNGAGQAAGVGAILGWIAAPVMQEYGRRKTRDWISDKLRKASEEKGIPLTETEIKDTANDLLGRIESKGVQKVSDNYDKIIQLTDSESDLAQTLSRVFEDLVNQGQIKFRQATPDEIRQAGLDWANWQQALALLDSLEREIPLSAHPLFNAVAEVDRILLEGRDPGTGDLLPLDINNAQVRELANQIEDYIEQNRETRQAEEASKLVALREADMRARQETIQELERAAIAELEKEQAANNQERITELQQQITELQHQMDLLREERSKYIQERAAQGRISIGRAKAQTAPDNKTLTKKAIRSGNLDIITQILQDNGFKTRDLSGTQIKQMAQLNWEMFADKDLGTTKSKFDKNVAMKAIEQNVVSGDAVLLRAGYTQGQIDQMDDKTWNRALLAAYREEAEALESVQPQLTPEQAAQIPDDLLFQPNVAAEQDPTSDSVRKLKPGETLDYEYGGKKYRARNWGGITIALLGENGNELSNITINTTTNTVSDIRVMNKEDEGNHYASTVLYEAERIFGDLQANPEANEKAQNFWKRVGFTEKNNETQNMQRPTYQEDTIVVDGIERPIENNLGGMIARTEKGLTNFWRWFGDSKVVNDQGRPLVVYHGTKDEFDSFKQGEGHKHDAGFLGTGFYFTDKESSAMEYTEWKRGYSKPTVLSVYLKANNPLVLKERGATLYNRIIKALQIPLPEKDFVFRIEKPTSDLITNESQKQGYDSVIADLYDGEVYYVVYNPNQIKHTENKGAFGIGVDDMYHQDQIVKKVGEDRTNANKWLKEQKKVVDAAVDYYGLTDDINEAGYILPDGGLLDFSGKGMGGMPGRRAFDHREIAAAFDEDVIGKPSPFPELVVMEEFINAGNIRFLPESGTFLMAHKPTPAQYRTIERVMDQRNGEIQIEFVSDAEKWGSHIAENFYYEMPEYSSIQDIKRLANAFFDGEGITQGMLTLSEEDYYYQNTTVENPVLVDVEDIASDLDTENVLDLVLSGQNLWDNLIDPAKYKSALLEFVKNGQLLRTKTEDVEKWFETIVRNTALLDKITDIVGHSAWFPETEIKEYFFGTDRAEADRKFQEYKKQLQEKDEELPPEFAGTESTADKEISDMAVLWKLLEDKGFFDKAALPDGSPAWSDYGLRPLWDIIGEYREGMPAEQVLVLINKALDVYHQNGDLVSAFIKGGAEVANQISNDVSQESVQFQDQPQAKLIATHNMSKEGLERALDLGGLVMPSMAITKFTDGAFTGYGKISFIGDAILANPTRTTDVYDRDAWTPVVNNIVHQFTEGGVERLKALVEEAKQKNPRDTNSYSVYRMNIEKGMSDDPRANTMAVELFSILHDIPREQARQNITHNWGEEKTEMHKQYLEWYNDKLLAETKAFIYEGYTPSGKIRLKPLTLDNLTAALKKQDRFGRMTGDFFTPSDIIKMNLVRFKNVGEIRDAQGHLVSRDEAHEAYKEIGSDFYNLASELNKHNVKESTYTSSDQRLAWALIIEKGTLEERLAKQNLKNDAESVKKVKKFIKDVKNIKVPYFEVKPRRAVKFYEFSGVILPKGESYDNLAARLEEEGVLNIYRATTPEEKSAALKDLTEKRPWTLLQNKKTSKSTTGLGTEHRGGYDPMTKAIIFNKTSDLSTLFHESAHYWFDRNLRYYRTGLASPEWKKKWEDVMNELGATPNARGTIPVSAIRSASEKFARSMEAYLREGKYESAAIQWAHQDYANMVKRIYRNIWSTYWGLNDLSPAVKQWFDMFGLKTDDATTAFAEEDQIETDEQMVGAVIAEDATKPDVDAETKTIVADAGAQVVENPATQEIAVVPADPFETGKKARSKLPRSAEATTGVSMDDIIYNRRSMSDAFKAAQQLVNTDPVRAWEILKDGQEMVDGLYAGDIYRALVAKYQAENNPTMLKNVVQAFAGAARRAGRSVKAFDLESPRISFEKTINSLDKIFDTKKNDKRIEKVKNELKEFLHDPSALRVGWEEFKNIVGCK